MSSAAEQEIIETSFHAFPVTTYTYGVLDERAPCLTIIQGENEVKLLRYQCDKIPSLADRFIKPVRVEKCNDGFLKQAIKALIRGNKFTISLLEKVLRGEEV